MKGLLLTLTAALCLASPIAQAQQQRASPQQCQELQRSCENKEQLGERGEGNCAKFRQLCQPRGRQPQQPQTHDQVCAELRQACLYKEQVGERGEGNCRRYRQTCRGQQ